MGGKKKKRRIAPSGGKRKGGAFTHSASLGEKKGKKPLAGKTGEKGFGQDPVLSLALARTSQGQKENGTSRWGEKRRLVLSVRNILRPAWERWRREKKRKWRQKEFPCREGYKGRKCEAGEKEEKPPGVKHSRKKRKKKESASGQNMRKKKGERVGLTKIRTTTKRSLLREEGKKKRGGAPIVGLKPRKRMALATAVLALSSNKGEREA